MRFRIVQINVFLDRCSLFLGEQASKVADNNAEINRYLFICRAFHFQLPLISKRLELIAVHFILVVQINNKRFAVLHFVVVAIQI